MKKVLSIILVLLVLCVLIPTSVLADGGDVYVSSTGSDENSGTAEAPYATLEKALEAVPDNGTIHVVGTVAPTVTDCTRRGRTITITGGTLDMTGISYLVLGDAVTFRDITLVGPTAESAEVRIYANGYKLVMDTGITTSGKVELFGGGRWRKVDKTDVTVLSGTYRAIYGGGNGSTNGTAGSSLVKGDVNLYVGGDTNADANPKSHSFESGWVIFGGGRYDSPVGGKVNLTFTGNAKANYVFGGGRGYYDTENDVLYENATVAGGVNMLVSGNVQTMDVTGGGFKCGQNGGVNLIVTGGQMEQIFGGAEGASENGDVTVSVLGGTITRRVFGGCYNEDPSSPTFFVNGHIRLTLSGEANLDYTYGNDMGIYARSRSGQVSATETSELIFADSKGYTAYKDKLGANSSWMTYFMGDVTPADTIHYLQYEASGATLSAHCVYHPENTAEMVQATLSLDSACVEFTGKPITPAKVTTTNWVGVEPQICYENNVEAGTATASITVDGVTASVNFEIEPVFFRSVVLNESIGLNFNVKRSFLVEKGFEKLEFYKDGTLVQTITEIPAGSGSLVTFPFRGLNAAQMGKEITARYCFADGTYVERKTSVLDYAMTLLGQTEDAKLKTLLVDMIHYGAASQIYRGETDGIVSVGEYAAFGTTGDPQLVSHTELTDKPETELATWYGATLNLRDSIRVRVYFQADNADALILKITCGGKTWEIDNFKKGATDGYYAEFAGLNPAQLRLPFTAALYNAQGERVSQKLTYSVVSYASAFANGNNADMAALVKAIMRYGDAVSNWLGTGVVNGQLVKVDGKELPDEIVLESDTVTKQIAVAEDGTFSVSLPMGSYQIHVEDYKIVSDCISDGKLTVGAGENSLGIVKLMQHVSVDCVWGEGSAMTENGNSVTITTTAGGQAMTEYQIGNQIADATSWIAGAKIEGHSSGNAGFTVGGNDANNGMILFAVSKSEDGVQLLWDTCNTYYVTAEGISGAANAAVALTGDALAAVESGSYQLTVKASNINGEATGTVAVYINDIEVLALKNAALAGALTKDGQGKANHVMDLGNVHVSMAVAGSNASAGFADYYFAEETLEFAASITTAGETEYFRTLEDAVAKANAADTQVQIVLLKSVCLQKTIEIQKHITIVNASGKHIAIRRGADLTGDMFLVSAGSLTLGSDATDQLILDGGSAAAVPGRTVMVAEGAEFTLYQNVTLRNANSTLDGGALYVAGTASVYGSISNNKSQKTGAGLFIAAGANVSASGATFSGNDTTQKDKNGGAVYVAGNFTDTDSSYTDNKARNGGAIFVPAGGVAILNSTQNAVFADNVAVTANGGAIFVNGGNLTLNGYTFEGNTAKSAGSTVYVQSGSATVENAVFQGDLAQKIHVVTELKFQNLTGAQIVQTKAAASIVLSGNAGTNVQLKPAAYTAGNVVLTGEGVDFTQVAVTAKGDGSCWRIDENGVLQSCAAASITTGEGTTEYNTLEEAVAAANAADGQTQILVLENCTVTQSIEIQKDIILVNAPGKEITVSRGMAEGDLFTVVEGASLTLGTNAAEETGKLIIDGSSANAIAFRTVTVNAGASFTLGSNATLQGANATVPGGALHVTGTAQICGSICNNKSRDVGAGVYIAAGANVTASGATFSGNDTTENDKNGGAVYVAGTLTDTNSSYIGNMGRNGGAIFLGTSTANVTMTATDAVFSGNIAKTANGGAIYVNGGSLTLNGYTFEGNTAKTNADSAIHIANGSATVENAVFQGEAVQKIYVVKALTFQNLTNAQIVATKTSAIITLSGAAGTNVQLQPAEYTEGTVVVAGKDVDFSAIGVAKVDDACWAIDAEGKLQKAAIAANGKYYVSINSAVAAAQAGATIELLTDITLTEAVTVNKDLTIINNSGKVITVSRGALENNMFTVTKGGALTLGSNDAEETGKLIIDGASEAVMAFRSVKVNSGASFTLGKNATLCNANSSVQGGALYVAGTAQLYGTISHNKSQTTGAGLYVADGANVNCTNAVFANNDSTEKTQNGGAVYIAKATFADNGSTYSDNKGKNGAAIFVGGTDAVVTVENATFTGNQVTANGAAIYANGGTVTIRDLTCTGNTKTDGSAVAAIYWAKKAGSSLVNEGGVTVDGAEFTQYMPAQ